MTKQYDNRPWNTDTSTIIINNSTVDHFTDKGIPFANSSGNLIEDPTDFFYNADTLTTPAINTEIVKIVNVEEGSIGGLVITTVRELHTLDTAATSATATLEIPEGAMLLGVQFNVDEAVTTDGNDDTWEAAFVTGSTTAVAAAGQLGAIDTKVNTLIVPEITTDVTEIEFTAGNSEDFVTGVIEVVVYYATFANMADA